jgi:polyisoprenoid-binding protein YceI
MKRIYTFILLLTMLGAFAQESTHNIDYSKSSVSFKIKNAGITVDGEFKAYEVSLQIDPKNLTAARCDGKINVASIHTGINARDNHLRNKDYFQVDKYPDIIFKSTGLKQQLNGYLLSGKLTIKDVTKEVYIPVVFTKTGNVETYEAKLTIDRLDFHVGEDSWVMSNEVMIQIKIITK